MAWLHTQPGYRRCIRPADIAYLNVTKGEERQARTGTPKQFASFEEFRSALFAMPSETEIERRDQALMALLLMLGVRDAAIIGLKIKDVDLAKRFVFQDPRHARTKFRKAIDSFFLPVGDDVIAVFTDWFRYLKDQKGFGLGDPVFPKAVAQSGTFGIQELSREHWANATAVRACFKAAFDRIGLPFSKPHSVRDTLTQLAYSRKWNVEQMKALSQNLGHDSPLTTLGNYGRLTRERQGEVILGLAREPAASTLDDLSLADLAEAIAAKVKAEHRGPRI
jgi:integrase